MARMYARKRGKSGSHRPDTTKAPEWVTLKPKEIEGLVVKLAGEDKTSAHIGAVLRDQYAVPNVRLCTGKRINDILSANKLSPEFPDDLIALIRKAQEGKKHIDANKMDRTAKRGLQLTEAKIHRLTKYYKKIGRVPADWKYSLETSALLIH